MVSKLVVARQRVNVLLGLKISFKISYQIDGRQSAMEPSHEIPIGSIDRNPSINWVRPSNMKSNGLPKRGSSVTILKNIM